MGTIVKEGKGRQGKARTAWGKRHTVEHAAEAVFQSVPHGWPSWVTMLS